MGIFNLPRSSRTMKNMTKEELIQKGKEAGQSIIQFFEGRKIPCTGRIRIRDRRITPFQRKLFRIITEDLLNSSEPLKRSYGEKLARCQISK